MKKIISILFLTIFFLSVFPSVSFGAKQNNQLLVTQLEVLRVQEIIISATDRLLNNEKLSGGEINFIFSQFYNLINLIKLVDPGLVAGCNKN